MNEVVKTYIIEHNGSFKTLYVTKGGKFFIPTHIVGQLKELKPEDAINLYSFGGNSGKIGKSLDRT